MQILDRAYYTNNILGSDRIFYGSYPYKVKLHDNNINYCWRSENNIRSWFSDPANRRIKFDIKRADWSMSRNYYFLTKTSLDTFVTEFTNDIEYISGPISNKHVDALNIVNSQNSFGYNRYCIKGNNYFHDYDMKLTWKWNAIHQFPAAWLTYDDLKKHRVHCDTLGNTVKEISNNARWHERNVYINSNDLEEIEFFIKLRHGDIIDHTVEVLLIENM